MQENAVPSGGCGHDSCRCHLQHGAVSCVTQTSSFMLLSCAFDFYLLEALYSVFLVPLFFREIKRFY